MQKKSFTIKELASLTECEILGDSDHRICGVDDLESATSQDAAFLDNPRYEQQMQGSKAGVIFVHPTAKKIEGKNYLISHKPSFAFQKVINAFISKADSGFEGVHPTAVIHQTAVIGEGVTIGPYSVIEKDVVIGASTVISNGVSIGAESKIGANCTLHPHVVVRERCVIKDRVILQPGCVIGSCGFGYYTDQMGKHHNLKQVGNVIIEDDVEIGANTTIDRARFKSTLICRGSKIDNLVQIAHQVQVGEDNLIVSQTGIAGSTKTGKNVILGGQVGVIGHITIADQVILAARAAVSKSILKAGIYSGAPATPIKEFNEQIVLLRNVKKIVTRLKTLEENQLKRKSFFHFLFVTFYKLLKRK